MRAAAGGVTVTRAVFPLLDVSRPFLLPEERDALWAIFQVPVYALLVDARGRIIGCECEVQEGLHIGRPQDSTPPAGVLETGACECGRPGPRLMPHAQLSGMLLERVG